MSESVTTPAAVYTLGGAVDAGHLLGMPVDAAVLGTVTSVAVTMMSGPKNRRLVVAHTIIDGLLGGVFASLLTYSLVGEAIDNRPPLGEQCLQLAHVSASVAVGLLWQVLLRLACTVWPSLENHAGDIVEWLLNLLLQRPKK